MRIAVIDDDADDRARVLDRIGACAELQRLRPVVDEFDSAEAALASPETYDIAFLDVLMGGRTGIECAREMQAADPALTVVLVTSSADWMQEGFRAHVFDYLLKGFSQEDFDRTCADILRRVRPNEDAIVFPERAMQAPLKLSELVSATTSGHYVNLDTPGGAIRLRMTFTELQSLIPAGATCMYPCNRGVMVNLDYVKGLRDGAFVMCDGRAFPIKKRLVADARRAYLRHLTERYLQR